MTDPVTVRSRRAVLVGVVWMVVAAILFAAGMMLLFDQRRVWLELPLAPVAALIGLVTARSTARFDADGVEIRQGLRRRRRILWANVAEVVVESTGWLGAPVWLQLHDGEDLDVTASWGLARRRRAELAAAIAPLCAPHGVRVVTDDDLSDFSGGSQPDLT